MIVAIIGLTPCGQHEFSMCSRTVEVEERKHLQ